MQHFHHRVGIGKRCRLGSHNDDGHVGIEGEFRSDSPDAGARVDDKIIVVFLKRPQLSHQESQQKGIKVGEPFDTGSAGKQVDARRPRGNYFLE